jgi:SLOG family YspA-like protein
MKLIIAGSRDLCPTVSEIRLELEKAGWFDKVKEVVSGGAVGVDTMGERFAKFWDIPVKRFPANWNYHGKKAGVLRNEEMGRYANALLAFWDSKSKGTKHMIWYMKYLGKPVHVWKDSIEEESTHESE